MTFIMNTLSLCWLIASNPLTSRGRIRSVSDTEQAGANAASALFLTVMTLPLFVGSLIALRHEGAIALVVSGMLLALHLFWLWVSHNTLHHAADLERNQDNG